MSGPAHAPVQIGDWVVDPNLDTITRATETHKLEPRATRLLMLLAQTPGEVVSVEQMLNEVWAGVVVGPASVYQAISQLRRLLGDTDPEPTYIATVPRRGYRLLASVRTVAPAMPANIAAPTPTPTPTPVEPTGTHRSARRTLWFGALGLLVLAGIAWWPLKRWLAPPAALPSIVVLPFIDLTEDQKEQSFCDGLTEELSNWLAQIPTLRVVARTSAFAYRDRAVDVRSIGRELGTTHVLEGSLRRSGDHLRITAQLVSTRDGFHLWSADFDRPLGDVVKVQEEIARSVADNLEIRLSVQTGLGFAARRGGTPEAYQLYLLARHHQQQLTRDSNDRAIGLYQRALGLDQSFALLYAGLASAYLNQRYLNGLSVKEESDLAEPLLAMAMRLDPNLPEAFGTRGALRTDQGRNEEATADLRRAIELNPNDSQAYAELGYLAAYNARPRESLASYSAAVTLDPLNFNLHARRCLALADMARFDEAELACARARELAPEASWAYVASSWLDWSRGRIAEALKWNALALKASPNEFTLYKDRVSMLVSVGLLSAARSTLEQARPIASDPEAVAVRLAELAYYDGGVPALRDRLRAEPIGAAAHADTLLQGARLELWLGDPVAAKQMLQQALAAPDLMRATLDTPWMEREGESNELALAEAEFLTAEPQAAQQRLQTLSSTLERMRRDGIERYGLYTLLAEIAALRGDGSAALAALSHAEALGWCDATRAEHDPAFTNLLTRSDFRALIERLRAQDQRIQHDLPADHG